MRLKLIVKLWFTLMCMQTYAFAIEKDSIAHISISNQLLQNETSQHGSLAPFEFPFYDIDATKMYIEILLHHTEIKNNQGFIFLEIKKKSTQQFRLRPVLTKKIELQNKFQFIDSLEFSQATIGSGNYELIVNWMEDSFKVIDIQKVGFQILRENKIAPPDEYITTDTLSQSSSVDLSKTFVGKYNLAAIKKNILTLTPLAKGVELKVIRDLSTSEDLQMLKQFFYNFWKNKNNTDPEKAWQDYVQILNEIGKKYGTASVPGYETDRGRIYIQYGVPDRVERIPNEKNALPYEVWFYYSSGDKTNLKFLFFQPGMIAAQMFLLHSNVEQELINPYWKDQLLQDPQNGDNKLTHRVFEFFK